MTPSSDRASLIAKIKAIQTRTIANGCTEAEAIQAAAALSHLMSKYDLTLTDIEIGEEKAMLEFLTTGKIGVHEVFACCVAIARFTDTKIWRRGADKALAILGLPRDVEMASFLISTIKSAMDREVTLWGLRAIEIGESAGKLTLAEFLRGMSVRISERLDEIKKNERATTRASTGRDLVVVKSAVVNAAFVALGIKLGHAFLNRTGLGAAYRAGQAAGNSVSFNRPITSSGNGTRLISRS